MLHRVDDWRTLDGPRFFRYAVRLSAYQGVMAARVEEERRGGLRGVELRARPSAAPQRRAQPANDPNIIAKLEAQGWIEHRKG